MKSVTLTSLGYEFLCHECGNWTSVSEVKPAVECGVCHVEFMVSAYTARPDRHLVEEVDAVGGVI